MASSIAGFWLAPPAGPPRVAAERPDPILPPLHPITDPRIPAGGAAGEVLTKLSSADFDTGWQAGAGGETDTIPPIELQSSSGSSTAATQPPRLASDLIAAAKTATTAAELDQIEAEAQGRTTVINAVHDRRDQLGLT